jgi:hypothetical protein
MNLEAKLSRLSLRRFEIKLPSDQLYRSPLSLAVVVKDGRHPEIHREDGDRGFKNGAEKRGAIERRCGIIQVHALSVKAQDRGLYRCVTIVKASETQAIYFSAS